MNSEFTNVNFLNCHVAVAKNGGPIAAIRKGDYIHISMQNDFLRDQVTFFSNSGLVINKVSLKDNKTIVGFDFIDDELLLVVLAGGTYYIVDPNAASQHVIKQFEILDKLKKDPILSVKVRALCLPKLLVCIPLSPWPPHPLSSAESFVGGGLFVGVCAGVVCARVLALVRERADPAATFFPRLRCSTTASRF